MHATQIAYLEAKSTYEAIQTIARNHMKQYEYLLDGNDGDIDTYTNLDCDKREELSEIEARQALKVAETELLDWARRRVHMVAKMDEKSEIEIAFAAAQKNVTIRNKVLDAAMRLS